MRNVGLVLVALSILIGGAALWGLKTLGASHAAAAPAAHLPQTAVVVAARTIGFGEPIAAADLRLQPWPAGATPAGAFHSLAALTSGPPRLALAPIAANAPILPQQVSGPGGRATLASLIRPGMRAATLRIDDVLGVAGFVLPGDSVDVLVTRAVGPDRKQVETDVLLQGVRVLAVDQLTDQAKNKPVVAKAATLEVTPAQAEKIALAAQLGSLSLALRSAEEPLAGEGARPQPVRAVDLGGVRPAPVRRARRARPAPPKPHLIEIVRGGEIEKVSVPAG
jgi:pilus assembly protein CpaB